VSRRRLALWLSALVASGLPAAPARADEPLLAPPRPLGSTLVSVDVRPFFNLLGPGWGAISDATVEHAFARAPFKVVAMVSPLALARGSGQTGLISHARLGGAYATQFVELGLSAGGRYQRFGPGGYSLGARLRLGAQDGLNLTTDLTYSVVRNYYTGDVVVAASSLLSSLEVPLRTDLALVVEGGFSFDAWLFGTVGLAHHLGPRGAPGTWSVRAGLGIAWVLDRFPCQYGDPTPCEGAAWATGPTVSFGLQRRF
jgi:hypothetical protein